MRTPRLRTSSAALQVEQCGLTLAHQFPWAASSYVAVGLALRRRLLAPDTPSTAAKRKQISKVGRRLPLLTTSLQTHSSLMGWHIALLIPGLCTARAASKGTSSCRGPLFSVASSALPLVQHVVLYL